MAEHYKKNYLTNVIFRIDFPVNLKLRSETPKEFQQAIINDFPILEPVLHRNVEINDDGSNVQAQTSNKTIWRFSSKDKTSVIELQEDSLVLIVTKYKDYTNFKQVAENIVNIFSEIYGWIQINRVGLRYINQIKISESNFFSWDNYINPDLIRSLDFIEDKNHLRRQISSVDLVVDEDISLNFKYGIFNSSFPNEIIEKEFILDYDCYTHVQIDDKENLIKKIDYFNEMITNYFEKSINDGLREELNKQ